MQQAAYRNRAVKVPSNPPLLVSPEIKNSPPRAAMSSVARHGTDVSEAKGLNNSQKAELSTVSGDFPVICKDAHQLPNACRSRAHDTGVTQYTRSAVTRQIVEADVRGSLGAPV